MLCPKYGAEAPLTQKLCRVSGFIDRRNETHDIAAGKQRENHLMSFAKTPTCYT